MVVKGNQAQLHRQLQHHFAVARQHTDLPTTTHQQRQRGRLETRTLTALHDLPPDLDFPGAQQALCLQRRVVDVKTGQLCFETIDYALLSLSPRQLDLDIILRRWRQHWHIENKLHWIRDVVMKEDASRVRSGNAPQTLAALRNAVLSLIKALGYSSVTKALRHFCLNFNHAAYAVGIS
jgi:predicted transposase YbfD/YdcC